MRTHYPFLCLQNAVCNLRCSSLSLRRYHPCPRKCPSRFANPFKIVATNYIKSESNELLLLFVVVVVFVYSQYSRTLLCSMSSSTRSKKKNNVAVRPRCSRRRKYVTYANSYVALCTITGCLLAYAMRKHTHTHIVRYSMRFGMFLFLFFG